MEPSAKCNNEHCDRKEQCRRWRKRFDMMYSLAPVFINNVCQMFWALEPKDTK